MPLRSFELTEESESQMQLLSATDYSSDDIATSIKTERPRVHKPKVSFKVDACRSLGTSRFSASPPSPWPTDVIESDLLNSDDEDEDEDDNSQSSYSNNDESSISTAESVPLMPAKQARVFTTPRKPVPTRTKLVSDAVQEERSLLKAELAPRKSDPIARRTTLIKPVAIYDDTTLYESCLVAPLEICKSSKICRASPAPRSMNRGQVLQHRSDAMIDVGLNVREMALPKWKDNTCFVDGLRTWIGPLNHQPVPTAQLEANLYSLAYEFPRKAPEPPAQKRSSKSIKEVQPACFQAVTPKVEHLVPLRLTGASQIKAQKERAEMIEWNARRLGRDPYPSEKRGFFSRLFG